MGREVEDVGSWFGFQCHRATAREIMVVSSVLDCKIMIAFKEDLMMQLLSAAVAWKRDADHVLLTAVPGF